MSEAALGSAPARTAHAPAAANALSVDVEDYFHVQAFAQIIDPASWETRPRRLVRNTERLLDLFAARGVRATFFVLGWVAERHPALVRRIVAEGHELASHGLAHTQATRQDVDTFRADVREAKRILEDTSGVAVNGYRAPSFSIGAGNLWAFQVLAEEGHTYSSSIYPVRHDLYGMPSAPRFAFLPRGHNGIVEFPITTVRWLGRNLPCGGGGYFRLLPYAYSRWAMRRVGRVDRKPCIFYMHPWEIDPDQPRVRGAGVKARLRHYTNLGRMEAKLARLLDDFSWGRMDEVLIGTEARP